MATYKETVGTAVVNYAGNYPGAVDGELWYDSTNKDFKYQFPAVTAAGSWRTDVSINTARRGLGSNGTYTSSLIYGGYDSDYSGKTESWNGSAWTEVNDLNNVRNGNTGAGTDSTAAVTMGGYSSTLTYTGVTELWNGTNWTEVNDLNQARSAAAGTGTSTAAIATGGNIPPNSSTTKNESWNGTNWTEVNDLNGAREGANSSNAGLQTAALFAGGHQGNPPPNQNTADTEQWNGTNWTEVNNLNTAGEHRNNTGTSTSALAYGGNGPPYLAQTELWNGTNWVEQNDLSTARSNSGKAGSTANALAVTGYNGSNLANVEAWTAAGAPIGAWSTGASMNTGRNALAGAGTYTSSIAVAGQAPPGTPAQVTNTELYDGTSWTEVNDINSPARFNLAGAGVSSTSAIVFGGNYPSALALTETWNGTNWTEVNDLTTARQKVMGSGTQTSALCYGGAPGAKNETELWNGTNWTEVNNLNTARQHGAGMGTDNTSALACGGYAPPGYQSVTELWNGTNWTEVNDLNDARYAMGSSGNATSGLVFGGESPPATANTEEWNGASWVEVADLSSARQLLAGSRYGTTTNALAFGGQPGTGLVTEEWSSSSNTVKTLTD